MPYSDEGTSSKGKGNSRNVEEQKMATRMRGSMGGFAML
jgi:hypothetical protein